MMNVKRKCEVEPSDSQLVEKPKKLCIEWVGQHAPTSHREYLLLAGVSRSRAFRQPFSRKSHESFVLSGWGSMHQPHIESTIYQTYYNELFHLLLLILPFFRLEVTYKARETV